VNQNVEFARLLEGQLELQRAERKFERMMDVSRYNHGYNMQYIFFIKAFAAHTNKLL
jgi:hypothetical protein